MKFIHPEILQPGDIAVTTDALPVSCVTRWKTWPRAPRADLGMSLGTHAFMVCDRGDSIYYACEMRPRLRMTELQRYDHGRLSLMPHIVKVLRHPAFIDGGDAFALREKANDFMIKMHSCGVKYGWEEIAKVAGFDVKDNPDRVICSVWCRKVVEHVGIVTPWPKEHIVTPADLQAWTGVTDIDPYQ